MNDGQMTFRYSTRFGANVLGPDRTHFSLWAPDATRVELELEGHEPEAMTANEESVFEVQAQADHGSLYRYRIITRENEQGTSVPDPASRAQEDDVHGPSRVVDPGRYHWRNHQWRGRPWEEAVIYELHVGLFDGFDGVRRELPYLAGLGITAIELMPVAEFPGGRNWGYDGVLPYAVEASYGGPEALKQLVDEAHDYGLMVFLDVVYNHFGPDGNFIAQYASPFFRNDLDTPWGQAIDFRRPEVCRYFIDNALMWLLEYRMDGLRFDAVHAISEKDFLEQLAHDIHARIPAGRLVHLILENEANNSGLLGPGKFTAQWNDDGHNVLHVLMTDEREGYYADFVATPTDKLVRCLGEGFVYQGEVSRHGRPRGEPSGHLPPSAFVFFLQNHDQTGNRALGERLTALTDEESLAAATGLLLLSPMIPLLFMGEEWGSRRPFLFFTEHNPQLADAVREGRRSEFAAFPAFNSDARRRLIPDPNAPETFDASRPDFDARDSGPHRDRLSFYRTLLTLRHRYIVPRLRGAKAQGAHALGTAALIARWCMGDDSQLTIALNLSATEIHFKGGDPGTREEEIYVSRPEARSQIGQGILPARSSAVWLRAPQPGGLTHG